ncbi:hypothetical protein ASF53_19345 [Methylobacterium sp. Leaf123]|nr:hypothetical protein ASF53_19345 [Methylobacterium sp. Leaf123]
MLRPTEVSVVSGVGLREVHHAIDRGVLPDDLVAQGEGRRISASGCPLIAFYYGSAKRLTAEERLSAIREVSRRLRAEPAEESFEQPWSRPAQGWIVREGFLQIDFEPFVADAARRWDRYRRAVSRVSSAPSVLSGTPVIAGTRIPVHDVAASVTAGHPPERIRAAYPGLDDEGIALAALYASANPRQGRPKASPILAGARLISEERITRKVG